MASSDGNKHKAGGNSNGFKALELSDEVYKGILRMGFRNPTPVQRKALPVVLTGVDAVVMARTGSGKTCAFLVPLLEKLLATNGHTLQGSSVRGIILSPTRELSAQTLKVLQKLGSETDIRAVGIHGGEGIEKQFDLLASRPDVIVATPGRLAHLLTEIPDFNLASTVMCILDEADRLLEMGFAAQIRQIARSLPDHCQKVMLSATMPKVLIEFTKGGFSTDPTVVRLDAEATVSDELRIAFITCRSAEKDSALLNILQHINKDQEDNRAIRTGLTLIFAATRHHVDFISVLLSASGMENATIYGSMDHEARQLNLQEFKTGKKPILVVTDVAARGIDVPMIDHVVHYNFPASPKLFVHRSGRAARAGRIGYCWGLVEPDELPYMIELHLFLGRKPSTGETVDDKGQRHETLYTLNKMTPEMVHYGSVPESIVTREVENVNRIMNSELTSSMDAQALQSLSKVCRNAIQQYRRTRPEASREGVRRAKEILEGRKLETGERVGSNGSIPPHPLLRAAEKVAFENRSHKGGLETTDNLMKRQDFLRALSAHRPKESVFEAFATGGGKDVGVVSHLDKGRTTGKKHDNSYALTAMKNMRRQMRMARDKGSSLFVAGSEHPQDASPDEETKEDAPSDENQEKPSRPRLFTLVSRVQPVNTKKRISKAERKRQKKNPGSEPEDNLDSVVPPPKKKKDMRAGDFRDPNFFMDNEMATNSEEATRMRQIEAAMQPSAAATVRGSMGQALRMEESMMDILGDDSASLIKKQRMMRWDKSKRKYVKTTIGEELNGDSKSKKRRIETGQLNKKDKSKLGDLYEKWQKKTNRSVGRTGVFDDIDGTSPSAKWSSAIKGSGQGDEVKTAQDIKKDRAKKQNSKAKNMKKNDRKFAEREQRSAKGKSQAPAGKRRYK
jgi:ATP-dependent RNA helicase DDX54/DBP10